MQNLLTQKGLCIKGFMVFEMAFRARKVSGKVEKRAPDDGDKRWRNFFKDQFVRVDLFTTKDT